MTFDQKVVTSCLTHFWRQRLFSFRVSRQKTDANLTPICWFTFFWMSNEKIKNFEAADFLVQVQRADFKFGAVFFSRLTFEILATARCEPAASCQI